MKQPGHWWKAACSMRPGPQLLPLVFLVSIFSSPALLHSTTVTTQPRKQVSLSAVFAHRSQIALPSSVGRIDPSARVTRRMSPSHHTLRWENLHMNDRDSQMSKSLEAGSQISWFEWAVILIEHRNSYVLWYSCALLHPCLVVCCFYGW